MGFRWCGNKKPTDIAKQYQWVYCASGDPKGKHSQAIIPCRNCSIIYQQLTQIHQSLYQYFVDLNTKQLFLRATKLNHSKREHCQAYHCCPLALALIQLVHPSRRSFCLLLSFHWQLSNPSSCVRVGSSASRFITNSVEIRY